MNAYGARPVYRQDGHIDWTAKREETPESWLRQMLAELKRGNTHLNMTYRLRRESNGH